MDLNEFNLKINISLKSKKKLESSQVEITLNLDSDFDTFKNKVKEQSQLDIKSGKYDIEVNLEKNGSFVAIDEKNFSKIMKLLSNEAKRSKIIYSVINISVEETKKKSNKQVITKKSEKDNIKSVHVAGQGDIEYSLLGFYYHKSGNYADAELNYRKALEINPRHSVSYYNLAHLLDIKGQFKNAVEYFKKSIEYDPNYVDAIYDLGFLYLSKGFFTEAEPYFRKVLDMGGIKGDYEAVYLHIGNCLKGQGNLKEAEIYYRKSLSNHNLDAYYQLGMLCNENEREAEAEVFLKKLLEMKPGLAIAWYQIGLAYQRQNKKQEAVNAFKETIKHNPKDSEAYLNLAFACYGSDPLQAISYFRKVRDLNPKLEIANFNLGVQQKN